MTDSVKEVFKNVHMTVTRPDRRYKDEAERNAKALHEQLVAENELLRRHAETVESMLKVLVTQSQLAVNEVRQLKKALVQKKEDLISDRSAETAAANGSVQSDDSASGESEEIDLKGE